MASGKSSNYPYSSDSQKRHNVIEDRISNLHDSIIGNILSLLPTKNAVATCILSKRWELLWTTVINLEFCCPVNYTGNVEHFVQFVNYVLHFHKPGYLNRFSLIWETGCIPFYVNTWISAATFKNVHELIVHCKISKLPIQVQKFLFSCESLESLELNCSICISSEIMVSLPRLKSLKLISVYFESDKALSKLLDCCSLLKCLIIKMDLEKMAPKGYSTNRVRWIPFKCLVKMSFLTHLKLYVYEGHSSSNSKRICCVELDAPSLRYIVLVGPMYHVIKQNSLPFLVGAKIQNSGLKFAGQNYGILIEGEAVDRKHYFNSIVKSVLSFRCAKTLILGHQVIRALSIRLATIKMNNDFSRLTRLEVTIDLNHWSSLQDFIELSNNLEVLIVNKDHGYSIYRYANNSNWKKPNLVPICLSNSLRMVSFGAYDGYDDELAMIEYIVNHGRVLKDMRICFGRRITDVNREYELVNRKNELAKQISSFPRKSSICEVKFHEHVCQVKFHDP